MISHRSTSGVTLRATVVVLSLLATRQVHLSQSLSNDVEIAWDLAGVPHVYGVADEAVFFGQGYACARDRLAQMHIARMGARGRLTNLLGASTPSTSTGVVQLDRLHKHMRVYEHAEELFERLDPQTQGALRAYADGVNARILRLQQQLRDHDATTPYPKSSLVSEVLSNRELDEVIEDHFTVQMPYPPEAADFLPWSPVDCIAAWSFWTRKFNHNPMRPSLSEPLENEANYDCCGCGPEPVSKIDDGGAVLQQADLDPATQLKIDQYAADNGLTGPECESMDLPDPGPAASFSHGCVVAGGDTIHGSALLWADPQVGVGHPGIFHEVHLVNTDPLTGFNVRGIAMAGCPALFMGYSESIAWAGASLGLDDADLITVSQEMGQPGTYLRACDGSGLTSHPYAEDMISVLGPGGARCL